MRKKLLSITTALILFFLYLNTLGQVHAKNKVLSKSQTVPAKKVYYQKRALDTVKNTDFSLNGQYQFMLSRSKSSYGSKLINPDRLAGLWKSVNDTLRKERLTLKNAQTKVVEQEKAIYALQTEVNGKETTINNTSAKIDEISFLGISFTKGTYNIIVWSIIGVLAIALFIVIARSAKSILEAKHRTQLYDEISTEFQAYKSKSNEQQRKLARELQDERNIIEEMRSKGR